jgi:hypothetical protein
MAGYARRPDSARTLQTVHRQLRRQRTKRPRRGHSPSPTFIVAGEITLDTFIPPKLIVVDPLGNGALPEYDRIVAVDGWCGTGGVTVTWVAESAIFHSGHEVSGTSNREELEEPLVLEDGSMWVQPQIATVDEFGAFNISLAVLLETVPL